MQSCGNFRQTAPSWSGMCVARTNSVTEKTNQNRNAIRNDSLPNENFRGQDDTEQELDGSELEFDESKRNGPMIYASGNLATVIDFSSFRGAASCWSSQSSCVLLYDFGGATLSLTIRKGFRTDRWRVSEAPTRGQALFPR